MTRTPARGVPARPQTDRDVLVPKHRAVPEFVNDEATGQYEGEALKRIRRNRPTDERIEHVENRVDKLDRETAVGFAECRTRLDTLLDLAARSEAERERRATADAEERERRRKHTIALIGALAAGAAVVIAALASGGCA